jgi:gamma-glutamylcyclotransferase (GGCT)/AIG2-like uncharacterized protein YtfP
MILFVYGTLMKNYELNFLLEKSKFIGKALTCDKYVLSSSNVIPYLCDKKEMHQVYGEVYDVSDECVVEIDGYESEGSWYFRKPLSVFILDDNNVIMKAQAYFNDTIEKIIPTGNYRDHIPLNIKINIEQ